MSNQQGKKSCCTCKRFLVITVSLIVVLGALGTILYFFTPLGDTVKDFLPGTNGTNDTDGNQQDQEGIGPVETNSTSPTAPPTQQATPAGYQFNQCQDMNNCCNGLEEICDLGADEVLWATSHNAPFTQENGFIFGYNHLFALEASLEAGYRAISIDICNCGGQYQLCHGICNLGARDPVEVVQNIVNFLEANPTEIIMLNVQINSEVAANVDIYDVEAILTPIPGFSERLYVHDPAQPWPTLRTLKDTGKNLLLFHLNGPICDDESPCPDGFHYWFQYAAETEFQFTEVADFDDIDRSCEITRGAGSTKDFFAVNNFVSPPRQAQSEIINTLDFLDRRMMACSDENELDVNLMYVDFWSIGDLPELVQTYNKELGQRRQRRRKMLR